MAGFTGLMMLVGGKCVYVGKTRKGQVRDHRKGKCGNWLCGCCYTEAYEGGDFTPRGGWWHRGAKRAGVAHAADK